MQWSDIWKIAISAVTALGGFGVIFIAVIKFSSEIIAKRLEEKYSLKLNKELEKYKSSLDNKNYISKAKFDIELNIYRELSKYFFEMVKNINALIPYGYTKVLADKEAQKKVETENYKKSIESIIAAQDCLNGNAAFIPENIFKCYDELLIISRIQTDVFSDRWDVLYLVPQEEKERLSLEDYNRTKELNDKFKVLNQTIRKYLSELEIIN